MKFYFLTAILLFCASCSEKNAIEEELVIDNRPVTYGIFITGETSPEQINSWGEPQIPDSIKSEVNGYELLIPYPNPGHGNMKLTVEIPETTVGRVWLEKARWVMDPETDYPDAFVKEITNQTFQQGIHQITVNAGYNCDGLTEDELEAGFYRIYFESEDFYYWRDIYFTGYLEFAPEGMSDFTTEFCDKWL